jgi:hypothetical protein
MVFFTMVGNISSTKENREGNNIEGFGVKQNLQSQTFSQVDKGL